MDDSKKMDGIVNSGFTFYNNFDSANLAKIENVPPAETLIVPIDKPLGEIPDAEFNIWTKPDCGGTAFENGNRTWFYFGIKAHTASLLVRLNIVDLNRQSKMYSQGMAPVYRIVPGKLQWERIRDKPTYSTTDDIFTLSFKYKSPENPQCVVYFAFTYPFSYTDLQKMLTQIDSRFNNYLASYEDDIYYCKEVVTRSLGHREINLITISSYHGITPEMESRLINLFPLKNTKRPFKFVGKKVIFVSARVHPGETPSSFVFNGLLNLLLTRDDPIAIILRRLYVFKLVPCLNPDGVSVGHYRTDTKGVNLNRMYLKPIFTDHPSIYAARSLIRYYHYGCEKAEEEISFDDNIQGDNISSQVSHMTLDEEEKKSGGGIWCMKCKKLIVSLGNLGFDSNHFNGGTFYSGALCRHCRGFEHLDFCDKGDNHASGLFLYIDLHGHASKKGIFMYGNHFEDMETSVECMLLPKLMSMNNHNFHFTACNFTERNMYTRDKRDGMSREGSGRVAVLKLTGLIKSYTLECNYNTGRLVNILPATIKEAQIKGNNVLVPPKYSPQTFEEVGKSLGVSILDLTGQNPHSRLPNSEFHTINGLKDWLRSNCCSGLIDCRPSKIKTKSMTGLHSQGRTAGLVLKSRPATTTKRFIKRPLTACLDKKENMAIQSAGGSKKGGFRFTKAGSAKSKIKRKEQNNLKLKRSSISEKKISKGANKAIKDIDRKKFREICVVKTNDGKLKFNSDTAGPSKSAVTFLSFSKTSFQKCKFNKKPALRRLSNKGSIDGGVKGETVKAKRNKLKGQ